MKKTVKITSLLLVVCTLALVAVSCGSSIVGKWGVEGMTYEFRRDGTYTLTVGIGALSTSTDGTYEYSDGKLSLDGSGPVDCKISGDTIQFTASGITLTLNKQ